MKALTLWRPWDRPVADGTKPVENRPNPPPRSLLGQEIAIHAGKHYDYDGAEFIKARGYELVGDSGRVGAIVGVARIAGWLDKRPKSMRDGEGLIVSSTPLDEKVARAQFEQLQALDRSPWFFGPVGILLVDARPLAKPIPCKGMQGYWTVPADVEAKIMAVAA